MKHKASRLNPPLCKISFFYTNCRKNPGCVQRFRGGHKANALLPNTNFPPEIKSLSAPSTTLSQILGANVPHQPWLCLSWSGTPPHTDGGLVGCPAAIPRWEGPSPTALRPPVAGFPPPSSADPGCSAAWLHPARAAPSRGPAAGPGRCGPGSCGLGSWGSASWGFVWWSHLTWGADCTRYGGLQAAHGGDKL